MWCQKTPPIFKGLGTAYSHSLNDHVALRQVNARRRDRHAKIQAPIHVDWAELLATNFLDDLLDVGDSEALAAPIASAQSLHQRLELELERGVAITSNVLVGLVVVGDGSLGDGVAKGVHCSRLRADYYREGKVFVFVFYSCDDCLPIDFGSEVLVWAPLRGCPDGAMVGHVTSALTHFGDLRSEVREPRLLNAKNNIITRIGILNERLRSTINSVKRRRRCVNSRVKRSNH